MEHALGRADYGLQYQHGIELLVDAGKACATFHDGQVRDVRSKRIQCDCRIHKSLRISPAMAAGVADQLWSMNDAAEMVEAGLPQPRKTGSYRKRV